MHVLLEILKEEASRKEPLKTCEQKTWKETNLRSCAVWTKSMESAALSHVPFQMSSLSATMNLNCSFSHFLFGGVVGVCQGAFHVYSPFRCWLQADNTVKEVRNGYVARLAATLVQGSTFSCMSHHHLVVGHTHEDVDSVFSLVTSALSTTATLMTPRDVEVAITKKLEPIFGKNGMKFEIEYVQTEL